MSNTKNLDNAADGGVASHALFDNSMRAKKPNKLQHGILLAVFWLARHHGMPRMAANLAKDHGCDDLDVSSFDAFEQEIYGYINEHESTHFVLANSEIIGGIPSGASSVRESK